ncbi:MAG: GAF domain-containing protein [Spirulinaceae cyanobacterium SM2_1_0]|nr:GAF domain-containing protein [Spirulinaceae cyanobacterium SM2_1_0]
MTAPLPKDEDARLNTLFRYQILDTLPEQAYDDIVKLAACICETPISLITFIDHQRQWFKARQGLEMAETPRSSAFCAHAILDPYRTLIVPDVTQDARFANNPLVTGDPYIRFYAGTPLLVEDDCSLGTLCVIDRQPRQLSPQQIEALEALSRQVVDQLTLRLSLRQIHEELAQQS